MFVVGIVSLYNCSVLLQSVAGMFGLGSFNLLAYKL